MNFDDLKTNIVNLLKIYRGRGVSLRNEIHPLLASFTFLDRIHTWSSLFVHISELEEDIEPDLLAKLGDLYTKIKTDFNKRVLFEDKYLSVYNELSCYDQLKQGEFKHEVRQFEKSYDNQQAEQISLMV